MMLPPFYAERWFLYLQHGFACIPHEMFTYMSPEKGVLPLD